MKITSLIALLLLIHTQENPEYQPKHEPNEEINHTNNDFCQNYKTRKGIRFGFICEKSKNSIQKYHEVEIISNQATAIESVTFYSGLSSHPANKQLIEGKQIFTATIDCDTSENPIYRPTSTCFVGIHLLKNGNFSYMNFILEDHTTKSIYTNHDEAMKIWINQINKQPQQIHPKTQKT